MPGAVPDIMAMMNLERALSQQGQGGPQGPQGLGQPTGMEAGGRMQVGPSANFGMSAGGFPMPRGDMSQANTEYLMALVNALKSSIPGTQEYMQAKMREAEKNRGVMNNVNGTPTPGLNPGIRRVPPNIMGGVRG